MAIHETEHIQGIVKHAVRSVSGFKKIKRMLGLVPRKRNQRWSFNHQGSFGWMFYRTEGNTCDAGAGCRGVGLAKDISCIEGVTGIVHLPPGAETLRHISHRIGASEQKIKIEGVGRTREQFVFRRRLASQASITL